MSVGVCCGIDLRKRYVLGYNWSEVVMDYESGDDKGDDGEEGWLAQGWRSETGSLFQRWGDA